MAQERENGCAGFAVKETTVAPKEVIQTRPDVVQMTSVHSAFDVRIFTKISRALARNGYKVLLLAPHTKDETVDGVMIEAIPRSTNRFSRMIVTSWRVGRKALASKAKVCHFHDPELMPAGIILKLFGRKVIYDVHEDYSKTIATKTWIPQLLRRPLVLAIQSIEWLTALCADRVFAATPTIARHFPPKKTIALQNFPIHDEFGVGERKLDYAQRASVVTYVGNLTPERGSIEMVRAIGLVDQRLDASLHLAGNIIPPSLYKEMQQTDGWDRVTSFGFCDRAKVNEILAQSRIGLVVLHPHPNYVNALATKMFEYMSVGLPVVASDFPLWRQIIEDCGAGLLVDPMNPQTIAEAIEWLLLNPGEAEEMGKRGREAIQVKYNWAQEEKKLIATYKQLIE